MHVGALTVFEGPPPPFAAFLDSIRERLHLVPRYRQRLEFPRLESGRPLWVDDPTFTLDYHVRHTALPRPGGPDLLLELTARIFSQRLDRCKPLWEMWIVEGLEDDRFAVLFKTHHALIDGVSGMDLAAVLLDATPEHTPRRAPGSPVGAAARAGYGGGPRHRGAGRAAGDGHRRDPPGGRLGQPRHDRAGGQGRRRGGRRDRLGGPEPGSSHPAERPDRPLPSPGRRARAPRGPQARQGRVRRHRQRRGAERRHRSAAGLAAHAGRAYRRPGTPRARARLHPCRP